MLTDLDKELLAVAIALDEYLNKIESNTKRRTIAPNKNVPVEISNRPWLVWEVILTARLLVYKAFNEYVGFGNPGIMQVGGTTTDHDEWQSQSRLGCAT